jgi:hypothetical protein
MVRNEMSIQKLESVILCVLLSERYTPVLTTRTLHKHNSFLIRMFRELMRRPLTTPFHRTSESYRKLRLDFAQFVSEQSLLV